MEFEQLIEKRYSVRKYKNDPVPRELIDKVLEAGRSAPTARNGQPQHVFVCLSPEAREKAKLCSSCTFDAPVVFIICYDEAAGDPTPLSNVVFGAMDATIVTTHMMLEAAALGLGTCWVGMFDHIKTKEQFSLTEKKLVPVAFLPMGYPADDSMPSSRHAEKKPADALITYL
jgi:nitroreductase